MESELQNWIRIPGAVFYGIAKLKSKKPTSLRKLEPTKAYITGSSAHNENI